MLLPASLFPFLHISQTSSKLVNDSKKYKWGAKKLSMMALYHQYAPFLLMGGIALLCLAVICVRSHPAYFAKTSELYESANLRM
ncbi:hypothetical protein Naga_100728g1 [Nannochloropsis gaditana]|uniref:Uncharacterized protein n=1 Tax=Nannochloropsis gaditana TaxID=72520 RepID=W7TI11_9STRA|nr:hypothetical protein Naga_100728g1 [Nannochloropsis gaditana]